MANFTSVQDGNWSDPDTWFGPIPSTVDAADNQVVIVASIDLTLYNFSTIEITGSAGFDGSYGVSSVTYSAPNTIITISAGTLTLNASCNVLPVCWPGLSVGDNANINDQVTLDNSFTDLGDLSCDGGAILADVLDGWQVVATTSSMANVVGLSGFEFSCANPVQLNAADVTLVDMTTTAEFAGATGACIIALENTTVAAKIDGCDSLLINGTGSENVTVSVDASGATLSINQCVVTYSPANWADVTLTNCESTLAINTANAGSLTIDGGTVAPGAAINCATVSLDGGVVLQSVEFGNGGDSNATTSVEVIDATFASSITLSGTLSQIYTNFADPDRRLELDPAALGWNFYPTWGNAASKFSLLAGTATLGNVAGDWWVYGELIVDTGTTGSPLPTFTLKKNDASVVMPDSLTLAADVPSGGKGTTPRRI